MSGPSSRSQLYIFVVAVAIMAGYVYYDSRRYSGGEVVPPETEVNLVALNRNNPHLNVEEVNHKWAWYQMTDRASGRAVRFPKREATEAKVRFVDCDPAAIPPKSLYPRRNKMVCVEIRNPKHSLASYYFENDAGLKEMLEYFQQDLDPRERFSQGRGDYTMEHTVRLADRGGFQHAYLLENGWGFVSYREEKPLPLR
jgi:hypothetical protein